MTEPRPHPGTSTPAETVALFGRVAAILDLVADGAGCAILSRNAVSRAVRPQDFITRHIRTPRASTLRIALFMAVSALRPATLTQRAALALVRTAALERL